MSVVNTMSIVDLKKKYLEKIGSNELSVEDIRLFYAGKELKDDLFIYSYEIKDEMTL